MRGQIKNRQYALQLRDFSGLRFGKITPTDIDGFIEFADRVYVLIETKYKDSELPFGQRLALERLTDIIQDSGRYAMALIASHDTSGDIDVGGCLVSEYRYNKKWRKRDGSVTVRQAIEFAIDGRYEIKGD